MQKVRKFRLLRMKHHVSLAELAEAAGVSVQRVNQLELDMEYHPRRAVKTLDMAFCTVIAQRARKLDALRLDFMKHRDSLMDAVEETTYEL